MKISKIYKTTGLRCVMAAALLATAYGAQAQLKESVAVEGEYKPLIVDVERINVYPRLSGTEAAPVSMMYDVEGVVTEYKPTLLSMGVTGWRTALQPRKYRGYVDLGLGSWLNSNLSAGYAALADSVNLLDVALQFSSTSLYKIRTPEGYADPSKRALYNGSLMLDYTRRLGGEGILNAALKYGCGYFNYYGSVIPDNRIAEDLKTPTQTLNRANLEVSYSSSMSPLRGWHAGLKGEFMGYRKFTDPRYWLGNGQTGEKETHLEVNGGINFPLKPTSAISVDVDGNFLFYPNLRNYGMITLRPAFRLLSENVNLKLGVRGDISYDIMGDEPGKNYGGFHIAPEVGVGFRFGQVGIFAEACGGTTLMTLAQREQYDFYQMPKLFSSRPIYSPIDVKAGMEFGPFSGFTAGVDFRYAITNGTPLGGWYQAALGSTFTSAALLAAGNPQYTIQTTPLNLKGFEAGLNLGYEYSGLVKVNLQGKYAAQNGEKGVFNGYDRPRWVLDANACVTPIKPLDIEVGYSYRGVRNIYIWDEATVPNAERALLGVRLPDITDLQAGVTYRILENLSLSCRAHNLLNRHVDVLPGLQSEGITVMGSVDFMF